MDDTVELDDDIVETGSFANSDSVEPEFMDADFSESGGMEDSDAALSEQEENPASLLSREELKESARQLERKVRRSGVIYLSTIPPGMNVAKLREILSQYGDIGRIYLEVDSKGTSQKKKRKLPEKYGQKYVEGWVEFSSKRIARTIAESLNNQPVGGKRRAPYYESLWNMKYLHRFKWNHLTERLAHERVVRKHRLRQEMAQAKRQTNFYAKNIEQSKMLQRLKAQKAKEGQEFAPLKTFTIPQVLTDQEIRDRNRKSKSKPSKTQPSGLDNVILQKLFPAK
ncbi:activator of basal transcription 1-like [Paramacrobiotus metropolitanus]|uniref:activator of basal transcription 1-like n=1 Tax=Paramacrobiotus metropolitanus TaxID=2943436 RepID=UPI0024460E9A|nr:activator of basal transcription 1-like [Paramacrobiotus metropolitanus]